jgi:hypothetical protein
MVINKCFLENKVEVGKVRALFHYCQLPDRNFRGISRDIWNFSHYFKAFVYLLLDFLQNPERCSEEPWVSAESSFENTDLKNFCFVASDPFVLRENLGYRRRNFNGPS